MTTPTSFRLSDADKALLAKRRAAWNQPSDIATIRLALTIMPERPEDHQERQQIEMVSKQRADLIRVYAKRLGIIDDTAAKPENEEKDDG